MQTLVFYLDRAAIWLINPAKVEGWFRQALIGLFCLSVVSPLFGAGLIVPLLAIATLTVSVAADVWVLIRRRYGPQPLQPLPKVMWLSACLWGGSITAWAVSTRIAPDGSALSLCLFLGVIGGLLAWLLGCIAILLRLPADESLPPPRLQSDATLADEAEAHRITLERPPLKR